MTSQQRVKGPAPFGRAPTTVRAAVQAGHGLRDEPQGSRCREAGQGAVRSSWLAGSTPGWKGGPVLAPRGLRRCPARTAAWAAQPSPLSPSLNSPLPPHNPSSTQAPGSPHPELTAEAAVRWDSHPMLRDQAAEESKLPPGPILPQVSSWAAERANPLPLSLPRLRREPISSPKSPLEMRKEPIPSHRLLPSCSPEPISAPGQLEKLPQGTSPSLGRLLSSRRRTQGRAAPPSPESQRGWGSERALGEGVPLSFQSHPAYPAHSGLGRHS